MGSRPPTINERPLDPEKVKIRRGRNGQGLTLASQAAALIAPHRRRDWLSDRDVAATWSRRHQVPWGPTPRSLSVEGCIWIGPLFSQVQAGPLSEPQLESSSNPASSTFSTFVETPLRNSGCLARRGVKRALQWSKYWRNGPIQPTLIRRQRVKKNGSCKRRTGETFSSSP